MIYSCGVHMGSSVYRNIKWWKISTIACTFILVFFVERPAYALYERLDLSQSINGEITATLSGIHYPCTFGFGGTSVSTPSPGEFLVQSTIVPQGCPQNSQPPSPYSITATVGTLLDGNYSITWAFIAFPGVSTPEIIATQTFIIKSGVLINSAVSVPVFTEWGMIIFLILAALVSAFHLAKHGKAINLESRK